MPMAAEKLSAATGRDWEGWFAVLDSWGAADRTHPEIAAHLVEEHGVDGWWAQSVTVGYERARGRRATGQRADGTFTASASKTVRADPAAVYRLLTDPAFTPEVEDGVPAERGTSTQDKAVRFRGPHGERLEVRLTAKEGGRTVAAFQGSGLAGPEQRDAVKEAWKRVLGEIAERAE